MAISLFLLYQSSPAWLAVFTVGVVLQACAIAFCVLLLLWPPTEKDPNDDEDDSRFAGFVEKIVHVVSGWYPWHVFGAVLVSVCNTLSSLR